MWQNWESEELIGSWTLVGEDWRLVGNKTGATRLGFALVLKFFEIEARFPAYPEEIPTQAVDYVATQVRVDPSEFAKLLVHLPNHRVSPPPDSHSVGLPPGYRGR